MNLTKGGESPEKCVERLFYLIAIGTYPTQTLKTLETPLISPIRYPSPIPAHLLQSLWHAQILFILTKTAPKHTPMKVQTSCSGQCTIAGGAEIGMMGSYCSLLSSSPIASSTGGDQTDSREKREIFITFISLVSAKFVSSSYP